MSEPRNWLAGLAALSCISISAPTFAQAPGQLLSAEPVVETPAGTKIYEIVAVE